MNIVVINDDGWGAQGILTLTRLMLPLGHVIVIAPDGPRSGYSSCITVNKPIYLAPQQDAQTKDLENIAPHGLEVYTTNGTPADCVKLAINARFNGDPSQIDLIVSGINHGSNDACNTCYSGTLGICMSAAEHSIRAIGFSLVVDSFNEVLDTQYLEPILVDLTKTLITDSDLWQRGVFYNINFPKGPIEGVRWTRQCKSHWTKELEKKVDETGVTYYELIGDFINEEPEATDTDRYAIDHHMVSVCPQCIDMTSYKLLDKKRNE